MADVASCRNDRVVNGVSSDAAIGTGPSVETVNRLDCSIAVLVNLIDIDGTMVDQTRTGSGSFATDVNFDVYVRPALWIRLAD